MTNIIILDIQTRYNKSLYLDKSKISGQGLFTSENICTGEVILSFGGTLINMHERYDSEVIRSTCVELSEDVLLCEKSSSEKDLSDYINHSCNPNAGMQDSITVVAIKNIAIGEEILCDYAFWEGNENWIMKKSCICGEKSCRHIITGCDWKNIKPSDELFRFYSPFLRRRIINNEKHES